MDMSNRLTLVLGGLKVPASELTPVEWAAIVEKAADMCSKQLKYFAGFNTAEQWAHSEGIYKEDPVANKKFVWGDRESSYYANLPFLVVARSKFENERRQERLLLNKAGKFLVWTREWEVIPLTAARHKESDYRWTVTPLTGPITDDGLLPKHMLPGVGPQVLMQLHCAACDAWSQRRKHAEAMQELAMELSAMEKRIC